MVRTLLLMEALSSFRRETKIGSSLITSIDPPKKKKHLNEREAPEASHTRWTRRAGEMLAST